MEIPCRLRNAEKIIAETDMSHVPDDIMESDEDTCIIISGWWVHIPELNLNLYEGVCCYYDEEEKAYLPDFVVTVIMEADSKSKEGEWLCYEQDGFEITLANYHSGRLTMGQISELSCLICIPDKMPEQE